MVRILRVKHLFYTGVSVTNWEVEYIVDALDRYSGASGDCESLVSMALEHNKLHSGDTWTASQELDTISQQGGTHDIRLKTESNECLHLRKYRFDVTTAPGKVQIYKGSDIDTSGTSINPHCLDTRVDDSKSGVIVEKNPSINDVGTELEVNYLTGDKNIGGQDESTGLGWILEKDTDYVIRYTNSSSSDADGSFFILWCRPAQ